MSQTINLSELLRDSAYKLTQFKAAQIQALEASISMKDTGKNSVPYVTCLLAVAKRAVEMAIEQDEAAAMTYLATNS